MRQSKTLHNDQGINPRRRYNNCKYKCNQHRKTSTNKPNILRVIKGKVDSNTVIIGNFNTSITAMDRSSRQRINKEKRSLKWHIRSNGLNWYLWSIYIPTNSVEGFPFLHNFYSICCFWWWPFWLLYLTVVVICISLIISNVDHLIMCLFSHLSVFFGEIFI